MKINLVSPNLNVFPPEEFARQMWLVRIDKFYAYRVKIRYLQKVLVYTKKDNDRLKIVVKPKETVQNTVSSVKVARPQYTMITNDADVKCYIGLTMGGFFVFQLGLPGYDRFSISPFEIILPE